MVLFLGTFSILEPGLYKLYENYNEGQDMEPYKTFIVPFDTTKLKLFMRNDSVTLTKGENRAGDDEEAPKD